MIPKTELRMVPHSILPNVSIIEIWWDGRFIGTLTGADGPGVRILTKYEKTLRADFLCAEVRLHCPGAQFSKGGV